MSAHTLIEKIKGLPADKLVEVEDFVDFILSRELEQTLARAAGAACAPVFAQVWREPDDEPYDDGR